MEKRSLLELATNGGTSNLYLFVDDIVGYIEHKGGSKIYCSSGMDFIVDLSIHKLYNLLVKELDVVKLIKTAQ